MSEEAGRTMSPEQALAVFISAPGTGWLRERVRTGATACACGACYVCAYRTLTTYIAEHRALRQEIVTLKGLLDDATLEVATDNPFVDTPEEAAAGVQRDLANQQTRIDGLLPAFLSVLRRALIEAIRDAAERVESPLPLATQPALEGIARRLLLWVDDLHYDPYGNLATLEAWGNLLARLQACVTTDPDGTPRLQDVPADLARALANGVWY